MMKSITLLSLYIFLMLPWFVFNSLLAFFGFLTSQLTIPIDLVGLSSTETVCLILHRKRILTDEEYLFETTEVASLYDASTLKGYLFIMKPILYMLKNNTVLDQSMSILVKKWMRVHKSKIENNGVISSFEKTAVYVSTKIALNVGRGLRGLRL